MVKVLLTEASALLCSEIAGLHKVGSWVLAGEAVAASLVPQGVGFLSGHPVGTLPAVLAALCMQPLVPVSF